MSDESCNKTCNNLQQTCNYVATKCISQQAVLDVLENFRILDGYMDRLDLIDRIKDLPSVQPERKKMSNKEWVDFLSEQFAVSRTCAREMLHCLMKWKAVDNFNKRFSGAKGRRTG